MPKKPLSSKRKVLSTETKKEDITNAPVMRNPTTQTELKALVNKLNSQFGENAVVLGFPKNEYGEMLKEVKRLPTGILSLDIALGGGIPRGRFSEISGAYSSTKTSIALHIISKAQKLGLTCALADVEGTTDEAFLKRFDIDVDSLIYYRPDGLEEATEVMLTLQKSGKVQLGVIDSIAAMSPNKEQSSTMDKTIQMGVPQSLLSEFFRKYQANNNRLERELKESFTLIGINQLREKIGAYGDPEYTPGGRAKGFTASVDLRLRRGDWISEGTGENKEIVGQVTKFKIEKNKTSQRMRTGEFDYYFTPDNSAGVPENHYDTIKDIIVCAVTWGIIERGGAWYNYGDNKYKGLDALVEALRNDSELLEQMTQDIKEVALRKE